MDDTALQKLHALARAAAHPTGSGPVGTDGMCACACPVGLLADRDDGTVVRHGGLVLKAHAPDGDAAELRVRVALAGLPALEGILLPPVPGPGPEVLPDGRPLTAWPFGAPVDPEDPDAAPWEEAGRLLALLHRTPAPPGLPAMRAPVKVALAVERMRRSAVDHPAAVTVLRAWATLPAGDAWPGRPALCHGDFHLGQLVRPGGGGGWRLIDVDDMGVGDPAWDLARPAAWFAAGLLPPEVWSRFLGAYETAGGPATTGPTAAGPDQVAGPHPVAGPDPVGRAAAGLAGADDPAGPWARLDVPARALTVQTAALAVAKSTVEGRPLDEVEDVMIDTCARIASLRTELAGPASP
ncbi:aminoglycoside phosphotransferase family protein [Streptomyces sp. NPDC006339]|uniref:phosphotransferase family protein n=1 Tax=Streptomyces sp. NPDC006339 TaxID=3156755 RepID=UPI0033BDC9C3